MPEGVIDTTPESFEDMWEDAFDEDGNDKVAEAAPDAPPPVEDAPEAEKPVAEAPPETPQPEVEAPPAAAPDYSPTYVLKEDGVEKTLDLSKENAEAVQEWLEKGRNFDTVIERRTKAAVLEGGEALVKEIRAAGYGINTVSDPYTGKTTIQIQLPQGQATPEPGVPAEPKVSLATLDEQLKTLEDLITEGKGKAPDFAMLSKLNRQRTGLMLDERTAAATQRQQATVTAANQAEATKAFAARVNGIIDGQAEAIQKLTGISKIDLMKDAWRYAVGTEQALGQAGTPERVVQEVTSYLARKAQAYTPTPTPEPVAAPAVAAPLVSVGGGTPPGAVSDDPMRDAKTIEDVPQDFWDSFLL
jgi:hypothetical protein